MDSVQTWPVRLAHLTGRLREGRSAREKAAALVTAVCPGPDCTALLLESKAGHSLQMLASAGPAAETLAAAQWESGLSLVCWTLRTQSAAVVPDLAHDPRLAVCHAAGIAYGSAACMPVKVQGGAWGALLLLSPSPHGLTPDDLAGMEAAAGMAGLTVERDQLVAETGRQGRHLLALHEVSRLLTSSMGFDTMLVLIVDVATGLFDLDLCCVLLPDAGGQLQVQAARGMARNEAAAVLLAPGAVPDGSLFERWGAGEVSVAEIPGAGDRGGYLAAARRSGPLSQDEERLLSAWTGMAGVALQKNRLLGAAESAQLETVALLAAVLDRWQGNAGGCSQRAVELAVAVGRRMECPEADVRRLPLMVVLCRMQRLGCMPESIPGELLALVGDCSVPWSEGGAERSVAARIVAVVDRYLTAVEERGEAGGTSVSALLAVKAGSGSRFDPMVVESLEAVVWSRLSLDQQRPDALAREVRSPANSSAGRVGQGAPAPPPPLKAERGPLTTREQEILRLVAQGLSNREIAGRLYLSEATVKTHVSRILHKLGLSDRTKAAVYLWNQESQS